MTISSTITAGIETAIGCFHVTWDSNDGVTAIHLPGENASAGDLPAPSKPGKLAGFLAQLEMYFAGVPTAFDTTILALNRCTPFRLKVYETVAKLPFGSTASYGEVATQLGQPGASRAVGTAMADNPFPIVVPCHRILAAGGKIGGFRGGLEMKRWLLEHEAKQSMPLFSADNEQP